MALYRSQEKWPTGSVYNSFGIETTAVWSWNDNFLKGR